MLQHDASPDNIEDILEVENDLKHGQIVHELISAGASCENVAPLQYEILCGIGEEGLIKFGGIAAYKNKLFLRPHRMSYVLVIDGDSDKFHRISLDRGKVRDGWNVIVQYGTKFYYAPCDESSVLIIDDDTEEIHYIQ